MLQVKCCSGVKVNGFEVFGFKTVDIHAGLYLVRLS